MQWRWPITLSILLVFIVVTPLHAQTPGAPPGTMPEAAAPIEALHQVQSNDNLHLLAAYYYGDARQWVQIFHTNRDGIRNPSVIQPGQILRISLSPNWTPGEPYEQWRSRVHGAASAFRVTPPGALKQPPAPRQPSVPDEPSTPPEEERPAPLKQEG